MASSDTPAQVGDNNNKASLRKWSSFFDQHSKGTDSPDESEDGKSKPTKWSMGVLNDPRTHEVPGIFLIIAICYRLQRDS